MLQSPDKGVRKSAAWSGLKPNWRCLLLQAQKKVTTLTTQGWHVVFSDGSSVLEEDLGWVGGYGAYFGNCDDFSEPLPPREQQTNSRAELRALVRVLQIIGEREDSRRWALVLDSTYVIKGANGGASLWKERDWVGVAGTLVAHVDLWIQVLDLLSKLQGRVMVFHVHSHINLLGNDKADHLANKGRLKSLLYSNAMTPDRPHKKPRHQPPDIAEIDVILSSDEELDLRYREACRNTYHLHVLRDRAPQEIEPHRLLE